MDDKTRAVTEGLAKAIEAEHHGHGFYMMAAKSTEDAKGKEVFERLAAEELNHMAFLRAQYESILATGTVDNSVKLGDRLDLSGLSPIFSEAIKARVGQANYEMSALSIGAQLEYDAMKFYRSQAQAADDPAVKQFFNELAEWEKGHYNALVQQQSELKEDFWAESGFSPF